VSDGDARICGDVVLVGNVGGKVSVALSDLLFDIPVSLFPKVVYLPILAER
jgi:hypothetical protein